MKSPCQHPRRFLFVACAACVGACASAPAHEAPYAADYISTDGAPPMVDPVAPRSSADAGQEAGSCVFVATGCPCDVDSERVYCGTVHEQFGDYIRCSPAYRTCANGAWSECEGDRVLGAN